jgi:hypothetical protein
MLAGVAQLKRLTSLTLQGDWGDQQELLQQLLAAPMPLQQLHLGLAKQATSACLPPLNMASLTQLKQLRLDAKFEADFDDDTVLPAQLQRLRLTYSGTGSGLQPVLKLQQLQHLEVTFKEQQPQLELTPERSTMLRDALTRLALLPALQHVKLEYISTHGVVNAVQVLAAGSAGAWGQMPQLRDLGLRLLNVGLSTQHMDKLLEGLSAATSLTKLSLQPRGWLCRQPIVKTCNAALAQVVPKLQQLQHLELLQCRINSTECMAAIGQLSQLTELRLEGNPEITRQGLMQLTGLKQLTRLGVDRTQHVTQQTVEQLWAALRETT